MHCLNMSMEIVLPPKFCMAHLACEVPLLLVYSVHVCKQIVLLRKLDVTAHALIRPPLLMNCTAMPSQTIPLLELHPTDSTGGRLRAGCVLINHVLAQQVHAVAFEVTD
mmetsp:Transcript_12217/g.50515  ORF Transcript_12217/g.50515 Transcript_12217/m.50515 type:complete len:109 (-) Transcript_12217:339-665(-)